MERGRLAEADDALVRAGRAAGAASDDIAAGHALVQRQFVRLQLGAPHGSAQAAEVVDRTLPVFAEAGDERGVIAALRLRAWRHWVEARAGDAAAAWEEAAVHARGAGVDHERDEILAWIASSLFFGPTPVPEAIRRCEAIRAEVGGNLDAMAAVLQPLAGLLAMAGRFDEARELLATSDAAYQELGSTLNSAVSHHAAIVELRAGDAAGAERILRRGLETLEAMGDRALLSTTAAFLGRALLAQERDDEAEEAAALSAELASDDDLITQAMWRGVRARSLARRGRLPQAEVLARRAARVSRDRTDFLITRGAEALADLAYVLRADRTGDEARKESGRPSAASSTRATRWSRERVQSPTLPRPLRSETIGRAMYSKFEEELPLLDGPGNLRLGICAMGPAGPPTDTITSMQVWVWQVAGRQHRRFRPVSPATRPGGPTRARSRPRSSSLHRREGLDGPDEAGARLVPSSWRGSRRAPMALAQVHERRRHREGRPGMAPGRPGQRPTGNHEY